MDAVVEKTQPVVSAPANNDEKHDRGIVRAIAVGLFAIGLGIAYWFWPSTLGSPGADVYVIWSGLTAIGATALGISLWEFPRRPES